MKLFVCTDHEGFWPVGVASIVVAADEPAARALLSEALAGKGFFKDDFTLEEIALDAPRAVILHDGNY